MGIRSSVQYYLHSASVLQTLMGKVSLTVTRLKSGLIPNQRPNCTVGMKKSESTISDCKNTSRQIAKSKFYYFPFDRQELLCVADLLSLISVV